MKNEAGEVVSIGTSSHAFFNTGGKPIRMKQEQPDLFKALTDLIEK